MTTTMAEQKEERAVDGDNDKDNENKKHHEKEKEDGTIEQREDGVIWCHKCQQGLGHKWGKPVKQHLKSKTHKQKKNDKKDKREKKTKKNRRDNDDEEANNSDDDNENSEVGDVVASPQSDDNKIVCSLCHLFGETRNHYPFSGEGNYCIAPPVTDNPEITTTPFITKKAGKLPVYPDNLEEALQNYCVGKASRMPNIISIFLYAYCKDYLTQTRKVLKDAHINKEAYWCAMAIDEAVADPSWWPSDHKVPGYTQLIIGSGPTDIGIHLDVYGKAKIPVNTYLTICRGVKKVIMLPPGKNQLFTEKMPFPLDISLELVEKIKELGGYYFEVKPFSGRRYAGLFVPKGWHHWLLGLSDWAVGYGSSRF